MSLADGNSPRILILRDGALGDFILILPAIHALRRRWPSAMIELAAHQSMAELAKVAGLIDRIRQLDSSGMAQWFVPQHAWPERERSEIASFDLIVSYLSDRDGIVPANLRAAGAKHIITCSPIVTSGHAADHFLRPIKETGITTSPIPEPLLAWPGALREEGRHWLRQSGLAGNVICLHPGSGSARKNWPASKFAALANQMQNSAWFIRRHKRVTVCHPELVEGSREAACGRDFSSRPLLESGLEMTALTSCYPDLNHAQNSTSARPLFILGEADQAVGEALRRLAPSVPVLTNRTLKEVASILAASQGYAGNDSGITHLAAALGIPVVALFGPTSAGTWGPRGANVAIIQARAATSESLAAISPETVFQALERKAGFKRPRAKL